MRKPKKPTIRSSRLDVGEEIVSMDNKDWINECGDEDYGEDYDYDRKS